MKRGTPDKIKFTKLKMRLDLSRWQAIGLLETLWDLTTTNAIEGDIGRLSNEDIAAGLEWAGEPDELIQALIDTSWLDADEKFRLIVHDWSEHCATFVKGNLAKHGKMFADEAAKQRTKQCAKQPTKQCAQHGASLPSLAEPEPSLAQPCLAEPAEDGDSVSDESASLSTFGSGSGGDRVEFVLNFAPVLKKLYGRNGSKRHPEGSKQWNADETCGMRMISDIWPQGLGSEEGKRRGIIACEQVKIAAGKTKPMAWLTEALKSELQVETKR